MTAPHIAINGFFLDHPRTGTGVYSREMIARLSGYTDVRCTVIGHPEHAISSLAYVPKNGPYRARAPKIEKVWWEQISLPLATRAMKADVLYAPYFSLPLVSPARTVVTIHDLVPLLLPEYAPSSAFRAYFAVVTAAAMRAHLVLTDSECSARDIERLLRIPREKIQVSALGVDAVYAAPESPGAIAMFRERLQLPDQFILYIGGIDPRKNVSILLRAMARLVKEKSQILPLLIVSPIGRLPVVWRHLDPRLEAERLGLHAPQVQFLDWVDETDKPLLYAAATALVYPSIYEGFGLPPLEAMTVGIPVAVSMASSLPEVVGDAGLCIDPDDESGWAGALSRLSSDGSMREALIAKGRVRAAGFSWQSTADRLHSALLGVAN